jgi:hypothetical protein
MAPHKKGNDVSGTVRGIKEKYQLKRREIRGQYQRNSN